ncbi:MAG: hypothetical protein AAF433_10120 [Bacteroidota bacterium]
MNNSKLFDVFRVLERAELRRFKDFVHSPYFNKQEVISALCLEMIAQHRRNWPPKSSTPQALYQRLFPAEKFDAKHWSYLSSSLLRLCERFLVYEQLEDSFSFRLEQLRVLSKRGLEKSYQWYQRKLAAEFKRESKLSTDQLQYRLSFFQQQIEHFTDQDNRTPSPHLQSMMDCLDNYYLLQKSKIGCEMLSWQAMLNEHYSIEWYGPQEYRKLDHLPDGQLSQLYFQAYNLLQTEDRPDLLHTYIGRMRKAAPQLEELHLTELYQHALNYCARQIRSGYRYFVDHLFDLYNEGLEQDYLLDKGVLSSGNYKNMIKLGLGLGQLDWVEKVVENYTDLLPLETRKDAYHYNMADLHYYRQEYDPALYHLRSTEFTDVHYALGARAMLVKIYFEQRETDALYALLSSFYIYLIRNKLVVKGTKDAYLNFIRICRQLYRAKSKETAEKIGVRIEKTVSVNDRTWLMQQIENWNNN